MPSNCYLTICTMVTAGERGNSTAAGMVAITTCMWWVDILCPTQELLGWIYSLQTNKDLSCLYSLGCPGSHQNHNSLLRKTHCTALPLYPPLYSLISSHPSTSNCRIIFKGYFPQLEHGHKWVNMIHQFFYPTRNSCINYRTQLSFTLLSLYTPSEY